MDIKQFLLNECTNVRYTLREVLRHDYAAGSSEAFYKELSERLEFLRKLIEPADPSDTSALGTFAGELSLLSALVHQIERSHAGEFSWPFAESLVDLAVPICKERISSSPATEPIIRVYAEGGLDSYKINLESDLSQLYTGRRIFTIVFPRTLKHQVLLHSIFGHEIGHAAWTIPGQRAKLLKNVVKPLYERGPLSSTSTATAWLRDKKAPDPVEQFRKQYPDPYYTEIDRDQWESWFQEFMCDLFGMVSFGPSFLAAHKTLLSALDPTGYRWGPQHPPYACRKAMLWRACEYLGWNRYIDKLKNSRLRASVRHFRDEYIGKSTPGAWEDVFTAGQVGRAVDSLAQILKDASSEPFPFPDEATLSQLVTMLLDRIPACGSDLSNSKNRRNRGIDFRHILFAGWLAWSSIESERKDEQDLDFSQMNKLCEMGLLHQRAIDLYEQEKESTL
jgi:hypothetical protein